MPNDRRRKREPQRQAVDRTVADLNIAHFKKLLAAKTDSVKRQTIERLLAEEEGKLARILAEKAGTRKHD
jgi:hypothetical protein